MDVVVANDSALTVNGAIIYGNNNKIMGRGCVVKGNYNRDEGKGNSLIGIGNVQQREKKRIRKRKREEEMEVEPPLPPAGGISARSLYTVLDAAISHFDRLQEEKSTNNRKMLMPSEEDVDEEKDVEDLDAEVACVFCLVRPRTTTIVDCRHRAFCALCARNVLLKAFETGKNQSCPICRKEIEHGALKRFTDYN